ncbi:MAG: lectin-like protein [Saprospiraceae bacterium]
MKKQILLVLFFSFTYLGLNAQCNIPVPPAFTCEDAPIICDLDWYCSTSSISNAIDQPSTFCGMVSNNNWIGFIAGTTNIAIDIIVENCQGTQNGTGIQAQVFSQCGEPWAAVSNCLYEITPFSSETLIMNGLEIGKTYYLMTDGFANDICDYTLEVSAGNTIAPIPDPAGLIIGDPEYCSGATITYCVPPSFGAEFYEWMVTGGGVIVGPNDGECIDIDFGGAPAGATIIISVTPSNGCGVGVSSFFDVVQGPSPTSPDVDFTICLGESVTYGNTTYNATGSYLNTDIVNAQGCVIETIVNVIAILQQGQVTNLSEVICEDGTSSTGETTTGIYTYSFSSSNGCDSLVFLELLVLNPTSGILPVTGSINNPGDVVELQAVVNNIDPSISYIWTGPCVEPNTGDGTTIEVSCGGIYELQLSQTVDGITCLSPIYSVTVTDNIGGGNCPSDISGFTTLGEFGNSKYYLSNDDLNPLPAQILVESFGGHIATISSQAENDFLQQNISEMVYIGLNDYDQEGELVWGNGEMLTYDNIDPCSFCNENGEDQDFVIIAPWNGSWSFSNVYNQRKVIMEIPCGTNPTTEITLNCPTDLNFVLTNGATTFEVDYDSPTANTTCPGGDVTIVKTIGPDPGDFLNEGMYTIGFEATDTCGNIESCSFTITVEPEVIIGNCPDDIAGFTTLGEFGTSKYYLSDDISRPTDAQAEAEMYGGYLVSIGSQDENDFIQQNISEMVYIGLNDVEVEGNLEWFNNESFVYDNLDPCDVCNENSDEQDFVIIAPWNGAWSFSNFYNNRKYVMEIPCSQTLTNPNIGNTFAAQILNEITKPKLESLVPNPASDFVFVKINSPQEVNVEMMVYDARGALVKTESINLYEGINSNRVDIADFANGIYTIFISGAEMKFATERFVKVGE